MDVVTIECVRRWAAGLLLVVICLGTSAHGLTRVLLADGAPTQDSGELEGEEAEALLEVAEVARVRRVYRTRAQLVGAASLSLESSLRTFNAERRRRGPDLPLVT